MPVAQKGFLDSGLKEACFGCEACAQVCPKQAVKLQADKEGFRYPVIDQSLCVNCGLCRQICPHEHLPQKYEGKPYVFGGYHRNEQVRFESTSGGAFSAIVDSFCDDNYVIFGAQAEGLSVFHSYITDKKELGKLRKSKYSQSIIGNSYQQAKTFLAAGKKVLFSGTPCQIAGLMCFLGSTPKDNLLAVEVICEGVPSPLYVEKLNVYVAQKYGAEVESLDYRYTGKSWGAKGKWDFQTMRLVLKNKKVLTKVRWFNPFWSVWLQHLMSRPSCYGCKFTTAQRVADITLGDLWGVHVYCPELYGQNGGSSLIVCNSQKGKEAFLKAQKQMYGHELLFEKALRFQGPMRKPIAYNPHRKDFMQDLQSEMNYVTLVKKWAKRPTLRLLFSKYVLGKRPWIWWAYWKRKFTGEKNA